MLYNSLEESCKSLDIADWYFGALANVVNCFSCKDWRRKFQVLCLAGSEMAHRFNRFPVTHIDWRWETLQPAIDRTVPLLPILAEFWDGANMRSSESGGSDSVILRGLESVLLDVSLFLLYAELFRAVATVIQKYAGELEICDCHQHIWRQRAIFAKRKMQARDQKRF